MRRRRGSEGEEEEQSGMRGKKKLAETSSLCEWVLW